MSRRFEVTVFGAVKGKRFPKGCSYCDKLKRELVENGVEFRFVDVFEKDDDFQTIYLDRVKQVPAVYINGMYVGDSGCLPAVLEAKQLAEGSGQVDGIEDLDV